MTLRIETGGQTAAPRQRRGGRSGQAIFIFMLAFAMLAGVLGIVLDGGRLFWEKQRAQAAADAGAVGAVLEMVRGNRDYTADIRPAALNDTSLHDYTDSNATITVNNPPLGGPSAGNNNFVEVIVQKQVPTTFVSMFGLDFATVRARAVSGMEWGGKPCVLALSRTASPALWVNGNPNLTADCGIMSNSSANVGLNASGNTSTITGSWIGVAGGYSGSGAFTPAPQTNVLPYEDPLKTLATPSCGGAGYTTTAATTTAFAGAAGSVFAAQNGNGNGGGGNGGGGGTTVYWPGSYNNRITIQNGTVQFQPGTYCLSQGMRINGGTVTGAGVFFYNANNGGNKYIDVGGNADIDLTAPSSGTYKGVLFMGPRNLNAGNPGNKIARGNGLQRFVGTLYFPGEHLDWAGNRFSDISSGMVIANTINVSGTADAQVINMPTEADGPGAIQRAVLTE